MQSLSLFELNTLVQQALELTMPDTFWVKAELSEVRVAANGHCYLGLAEHNGNQLIAQARATIWRNTFITLRTKFEEETGKALEAGSKVLIQVKATFHPSFGFSYNVYDIDPTYTLGDAARRRQEILDKLTHDGIINDNKELELPRPIRKIAVISSSSAAGYGDFINQIEQSGCPLYLQLFAASMQGESASSSIIHALNEINASQTPWDCVVIIRGGGAVNDLNGFESLELAENVANFPLPIITGIGHERDTTVIDFVAHTSLKTPTAVAAFLIEQWQNEEVLLHDLESRLTSSAKTFIANEKMEQQRLAIRLQQGCSSYISNASELHMRLQNKIGIGTGRMLQSQHIILENLPQRIRSAATLTLTQHKHHVELTEKAIKMSGPEHVLQMGYSITRVDNHAIRSAADVKKGQIIETTLSDGTIISTIN